MDKYLAIGGACLLPNLGGIVSGYFMKDSIKNWYPTIKKPDWRPPNWVFGPVWTSLYCGIGYASYLAYTNGAGFEGLPNVGTISNYYCRRSTKQWYDELRKPWFCPPDWEFDHCPAFYEVIGLSSLIVYQLGNGFQGPAKLPLIAYGANLAINWAWSPIFFNLKKLDWAFYEILLLDVSTLATGYMFYQINRTAGYLFIPYAMWLSLATALTYSIWRDNPPQGGAKITEMKD